MEQRLYHLTVGYELDSHVRLEEFTGVRHHLVGEAGDLVIFNGEGLGFSTTVIYAPGVWKVATATIGDTSGPG